MRLAKKLAAVFVIAIMIGGCTPADTNNNGGSGSGGATGGGATGGGGSASVKKAATPQDAFNTMKTAFKNKDWKAACSCLTPDSVDTMAASMIVAGSFMKAFGGMTPDGKEAPEMKGFGTKIDALFTKYGIDESKLPKPDPAAGEPDMKALANIVKDKPAFIGEMMTLLDSMPKDAGGSFPDFESAKISDVKVDGDKAQGKITMDGKDDTIDFQKIDGSWKIVMSKGPM